jgi:hypothetical protein
LLLVFKRNDLAAFESVMTVLMWWGHSWNAIFPNPPLQLTNAIFNVVHYFDQSLVRHYEVHGVSVGLIGWRLLSTLFTEFLSRDDWLPLMDFVFVHFQHQPANMVFIPAALIRSARKATIRAGKLPFLSCFVV